MLIIGSAQAALVDRGGGFIYDDVLDITLSQSANIFGGEYVVVRNNILALSIYDPIRDITWDDWRLPSADVNGDG
ncbi:MAG: hypothetical protein P8R04_07660, partial [Gammaproteobacteria bacterium]|nr:hypothetical protein [Gammaproteobacteria bacterium]